MPFVSESFQLFHKYFCVVDALKQKKGRVYALPWMFFPVFFNFWPVWETKRVLMGGRLGNLTALLHASGQVNDRGIGQRGDDKDDIA